MNDNFYDIEDIEQLMSPQCEFHASEELKEKVIDKAKAVLKLRIRCFVPWLAAACIAGLLTVFLTPPKEKDDMKPTARHTIVTKTVNSTNSTQLPTAVYIPQKKEKLTAMAVPVKKKVAENVPEDIIEEIHTPQVSEPEEEMIVGEMPMVNNNSEGPMRAILAETSIPITNPENIRYTPEEIALIRQQVAQEYISRINSEIEFAQYEIETITKNR